MTPTFTDRQLDIMNILWSRGSATVREAKEELVGTLADVPDMDSEQSERLKGRLSEAGTVE